jgi:general secretion pathway protein A
MYENFYGLRERPFDLTPNPRYLFLTPSHREALCTLRYAIEARKGLTVLIGEAGPGKTTLVRVALGAFASDRTTCVCLDNPTLTRSEFYELLALGFGLSEPASTSKARFLVDLEQSSVRRRQEGGTSVLVVDEAQALPLELLEELRLLANLETDTDKLVSVILVGQPELAALVEQSRLRALKQRIVLRSELAPLGLRETAAYIHGRIRIAGGHSPDIFTREAVVLIHQVSGGIPRTISVVCDNALTTGFAVGARPIDVDIIREVCRDFRLEADSPREGPREACDTPDAPAGQGATQAIAAEGLAVGEERSVLRLAGGHYRH